MDLVLPEYPGRGVIAYRDPRSDLWWMYFLTGRSDASRARRLRFSLDRLIVESVVPASRDELRHYACTRTSPFGVVVGNGDHVDVLASAPEIANAVQAIDPEPDAPIYTPRIAILMPDALGDTTVIAVRRIGHRVDRRLEAVNPDPGVGVVLHTYGGTADCIDSDAVPRTFAAQLEVQELAADIWSGLDPSLRVGMAYGRTATPEPSSILP